MILDKPWEVFLPSRFTVRFCPNMSIKAAIYDYAQKNGLEFARASKDFDPDAEDHDHDSCEIDGDEE